MITCERIVSELTIEYKFSVGSFDTFSLIVQIEKNYPEDPEGTPYSGNINSFGVKGEEAEDDDYNFHERLSELNDELEELNIEASKLEGQIMENVKKLLESASL